MLNRILLTCAVLPLLFATAQSPTLAQKKKVVITIDDSPEKPPFAGHRPAVDVAILLDTSNSMDGLINQARSQLWSIVQQFAAAKRSGQTPQLRVALFEYGNSNLPAREGYIRQVVQLTDNLDEFSEALFSLKTNGGDEYCGQVIGAALDRLDWSAEPNSYKAIFIAGNEPFTQGQVNYRKVCRQAIENGIVVNTIHCGNYDAGISGEWQQGAALAEGEYLNINQDEKRVYVECPQDKIIIRLNEELNETYLWFGQKSDRESLQRSQSNSDRLAQQGDGASMLERVAAKATKLYSNVNRDLIDTYEADADALDAIEPASLPESMQDMSAVERKQHVQDMAKKRKALQEQIAKLNQQREAYLAENAKNTAGQDTFGSAVNRMIRAQLNQAGFTIEE